MIVCIPLATHSSVSPTALLPSHYMIPYNPTRPSNPYPHRHFSPLEPWNHSSTAVWRTDPDNPPQEILVCSYDQSKRYYTDTPIMRASQDPECNSGWDGLRLNHLGLAIVWCHHGHTWISDEVRYQPSTPQPMGWYEYCDFHQIPWWEPRTLPDWLIELQDQYCRERHSGWLSEENDETLLNPSNQ